MNFHIPTQITPGKTDLAWRRWLSIALRSLHLAGVVLASASIIASGALAPAGIMLMLLSGLALSGIELWHHPEIWRDVAGVFTVLKAILLLAMLLVPAIAGPLFWLLLISSCVISHAPREFRRKRILG